MTRIGSWRGVWGLAIVGSMVASQPALADLDVDPFEYTGSNTGLGSGDTYASSNGDTWHHDLSLVNSPGVAYLALRVDSGAEFAADAVSRFEVTGGHDDWSMMGQSSTLTVAEGSVLGSANTTLDFTVKFAGEMNRTDVQMSVLAFASDGKTGIAEYTVTYIADLFGEHPTVSILPGGSFEFGIDTVQALIENDPGFGGVPLPAPIALAGAGLLGIVIGRKRLARIAGA